MYEEDEDFNRRLGYIVACRDNQGKLQFLVDRKRFKNVWWSQNISQAFCFNSEIAAQKQVDICYRFKKGKWGPQVMLRTEFHK